ncbi:MAG: molybdopterin dinucleotide binding domain-containing protein [Deferribacterales bacterium]
MNFFCSKDCPDTCAVRAEFKNGKYHFTGIAESWQKTGFVCSKFKVFAEREINSGIRSYEMKNGEKREFESDSAAVSAFGDILEKYKNKRILYLKGSGSLAYNMGYWDRFMSSFAHCTKITGGVCGTTGDDAHSADFGTELNPPVENIADCKTAILFGKNAAVISQHLYAYLKELKKDGLKIVYIDPIRTKTADIADRYISIRPMCDGLIAAALLTELGFEDGHNVSELISRAGISQDDLQYLKDAIQSGKTAFIEGFGMQRNPNGMNMIRLINRLAVKSGNIGTLYYGQGSKRFWKGLGAVFPHYVHIDTVAKRLADGEFDLFVNVAANPAMTYPDAKNWVRGIKNTPTVVVDVYPTRTSENCQLFIKTGGIFAQQDFMGSYFFPHKHRREKLTDELADIDIITRLSNWFGIDLNFAEPDTAVPAPRVYKDERIEPAIPEEQGKFSLLSLSHPAYLNSQHLPNIVEKLKIAFINPKDAAELGIQNGDKIKVSTDAGHYIAYAEISDTVSRKVIMSYKNVPMVAGFINDATPPMLTDSGNGMVYYGIPADVAKVL